MNREARAPTKRAAALCSVTLLAMAAILRLHGLDWDQGQHLHPDERFLTMVETAIVPPHSIAEYFDTARSPLNPANHDYVERDADGVGVDAVGVCPVYVDARGCETK